MKKYFKLISLTILFCCTLLVGCGGQKSKAPVATYTVDGVTNNDYLIEGTDLTKTKDPVLTLKRGETYEFVIKSFGHPFFIKTEKVLGKQKAYTIGLTNNGIDEGTILFTVPKDAPDVLYYICEYHKMMAGELKIVD